MKPPLTVEAKVAEELRTWLAFELEHLNASNSNQFAHHVVTIFLHEGLDIEDEPVPTGDFDFFKELKRIRIKRRKAEKSLDQQRRAAVQFLQTAVSEETSEMEINDVIDKLMVKIDETKQNMNSKKTRKRGFLRPIAINVEERGQKYTRGSSREEKYNEAFPSLSGEDSPCKDDNTNKPPVNFSVWNGCLRHGKENVKFRVKVKKNVSVRFQDQIQQKSVRFVNTDEARACSIAMKVALTVIPDQVALLPETTEVAEKSPHSAFESSQWKSAFIPTCFTKRFVPMRKNLACKFDVRAESCGAKSLNPQVLDTSDGKENTDNMDLIEKTDHWKYTQERSYDANFKHSIKTKAGHFAPILDWDTRLDLLTDDSTQEFDTEVEAILFKAKLRDEQQKHWTHKTVDIKDETFAQIRTFPDHHGNFWQDMIERGLMALYPVVEESSSDKDISLEELEQIADRMVCEDFDFDESTSTDCPEDHGEPNLQYEHNCQDTLISSPELDQDQYGDQLHASSAESSKEKQEYTIETTGCQFPVDSYAYIEGIDRLFSEFQGTYTGKGSSPPSSDYGSSGSSTFMSRLCSCSSGSESHHDLACLWSARAWDSIQQEFVTELQFHQSMGGATEDLTMCALSDTLTPRADQLLQSAFVNSFFSMDSSTKKLEDKDVVFKCEEVEEYLYLSDDFQKSEMCQGPDSGVVLGDTCSGWLENHCRLGYMCPYSHPSI